MALATLLLGPLVAGCRDPCGEAQDRCVDDCHRLPVTCRAEVEVCERLSGTQEAECCDAICD